MRAKEIINIVFLKFKENGKDKKLACIFTRDGNAKLVSYDEGIDACEEIVKQRKITSTNAFKEMINKEIIHVVSSTEFFANFDRYVSHEPLDYDLIDEALEEQMESVESTENNDIVGAFNAHTGLKTTTAAEEEQEQEQPLVVDNDAEEDDDALDAEDDYDALDAEDDYDALDAEDDYDVLDDTVENEVVQPLPVVTKREEKEDKGILGFFKKKIRQIKESKIKARITGIAVTVGLALGLGSLYSCASRNTAMGQVFNGDLASHTRLFNLDDLFGNKDEASASLAKATAVSSTNAMKEAATADGKQSESIANVDSYEELLEVTNNATQKRAMKNVYDTLYKFNGEFANAYVEEGKDVKPALSFDEVVALQQAYNDYSREEILAIFNGAEVNASDMSRAYRDASLQLMGAYIIETSENPVDMSILIESEEGKEFYNRYHQMFLAAKEADGDEKLRLINEFFSAVKADFPITDEVRTEGIAHSDTYRSVLEGKGGAGPAVAPMVAAAEAMWQNYDIDYTLNDAEIAFFNDIGLCNLVDEKFERIEVITLGACKEDNTNPTYNQYKAVIIHTLEGMKLYVIDDAHRELTKLDAFQNAVNWHFKYDGEWVYSGGFYETTETHTETSTWTETETTYREEETRVEKPIPKSEKDKIDAEIEEDNERAKEDAEKKAEEKRQEMQEEEDKKKEEIDKEVEDDAEDLQDKIDDANDQIEDNHDDDPSNDKPVNEDDLGHGVDFDDDHSDENGNLDDSVENITTDSTGDQTGEELPDPEVTGAEFDAEVEDIIEKVVYDEPTDFEDVTPEPEATPEPEVTYEPEPVQESTPVVEYEEVVLDDGSGYYEEVVDDYVETLADADEVEEEYVYQK